MRPKNVVKHIEGMRNSFGELLDYILELEKEIRELEYKIEAAGIK